jgi:hypothetical protein
VKKSCRIKKSKICISYEKKKCQHNHRVNFTLSKNSSTPVLKEQEIMYWHDVSQLWVKQFYKYSAGSNNHMMPITGHKRLNDVRKE